MNLPAPVACLALVAAVHAQNSFVVPSANKSKAGNSHDSFVFFGVPLLQPTHVQLVHSTSDIAIPGALLKALHLRRPSSISTPNPAAIANLSITMSVGPNDAAAASPVFAQNLGASTRTVFNGFLNLPADPYAGPGPSPFVLQIPFTTLFPYAQSAGQGLVTDLHVASYAPVTPGDWNLDTQKIEGVGSQSSNGNAQPTCKFSNGNWNNSLLIPAQIYPSSRWAVIYGSILPNAPGVGAIGKVGVGANWGGFVLPIDLAPLGAPGCAWNTDIVLTVSLLATGAGTAWWPTIAIPKDPSLVNGVFYDQAVFLDPPANAAGLVTTSSSKWVIGSTPPEGAHISVLLDTAASPMGDLRRRAVIVEFAY